MNKDTRTVILAHHFEPRVNLDSQIVSLLFSDREGKSADIWVGGKDVFVVLEGIQKLIQDHPEIRSWKKKLPPGHLN